MHPTDGELLLSTEPGDGEHGSQVRAHVASCGSCAARLQALLVDLEQVDTSLRVLDGSTPTVSAGAVIERARRRGRPPATAQPPAPVMLAESTSSIRSARPPAGPRALTRAAAVLAFLTVAAAAAALPGSPVRRWLARQEVWESAGDLPTPVQIAPSADELAGVAFSADGPLELVLPETVADGTVALVRATDEQVRVRSLDPATGFSFGPGILTLETRATYLELGVDAPAGLVRLVVRVGDQIVFDRDLPFAADALPAGDTVRVSLRRRRQ